MNITILNLMHASENSVILLYNLYTMIIAEEVSSNSPLCNTQFTFRFSQLSCKYLLRLFFSNQPVIKDQALHLVFLLNL